MMTTTISSSSSSKSSMTTKRIQPVFSRLLFVLLLGLVGVLLLGFSTSTSKQGEQRQHPQGWRGGGRRRTQEGDSSGDSDSGGTGGGSSSGPVYPHEEEGHIINGQDAAEGEYPFYVKFEGSVLCGGSLISKNRVLTAGHCIKDFGWPKSVRIGATNRQNGKVVRVKCGVVHPGYLSPFLTVVADVAILKLEEDVDVDATTHFVQLERNHDKKRSNETDDSDDDDDGNYIQLNRDTTFPNVDGQDLQVIGFGRQGNGQQSSTLKKVQTHFVTRENCLKLYNDAIVRPEAHLCADVDNAGDCNGDSGGPLMDMNKKQVGIVSFGYGGCASEYQDVYAKVSSYIDFIEEQMGDETCPDPPPPSGNSGGFCGFGTPTAMFKYATGVAVERFGNFLRSIYGPPASSESSESSESEMLSAPSELLP